MRHVIDSCDPPPDPIRLSFRKLFAVSDLNNHRLFHWDGVRAALGKTSFSEQNFGVERICFVLDLVVGGLVDDPVEELGVVLVHAGVPKDHL